MPKNIILTGFSFTGKTQIGKRVAARLGWPFIDTDDLITERYRKPIAEIFATKGEPFFRELEREALMQACSRTNVVISTGGGAIIDPGNRELMRKSGVVICLEAQPETIQRRMEASARRNASENVRPLLKGDDPLERIRNLKEHRQVYYGIADWTVHTDKLALPETVEEVLRGYTLSLRERPPARRVSDASYVVQTGAATCPGYVGWGILRDLGKRMREAGLSGTAFVIADAAVWKLYRRTVSDSLFNDTFTIQHYEVPPGEASKSLANAEKIYRWLASHKAERKHTIVALGGGMAGDLAGFVAATYVRGMPWVGVPTTLLAMVDSSIGGKTAVNLPDGKNLVGAFHQPRLIMADTQTLTTLPKRELTSGWAEVVKHGLILDKSLFDFIRAETKKLTTLDGKVTTEVVRLAAAIKAKVVSEDERESGGGPRTLLNYGHTIGHALETALGYEALLHGEAISIGMMGEAHISQRMGLMTADEVRQQREALEAFGLPMKSPAVDMAAMRRAMALDKKVADKKINWVLLQGIGSAVVRNDVPEGLVEEALRNVAG
jgi:3-dehydroquinate synthase